LVVAPPASRFVFGHTTAVTVALLVPLSLQLVFEAAASGFVLPLRVAQGGAAIAAARTLSVLVGVPVVVFAAMLGGLIPAAWGFAVQAATYLLVAWMGWLWTQGSSTAERRPEADHSPQGSSEAQ
jgi:hypothetical protein